MKKVRQTKGNPKPPVLLGDKVAKSIKKVGGDKVAQKISTITGRDCGCGRRRKRLNDWDKKRRGL